MVNVGDKAPDFELADQNDRKIRLADYRGKKVLLAFFPFAFSPVCTDEMKCFREDMGELENEGLHILAISVDSGWSQKAWASQLGITHPVLSDFNRDVCRQYGVLRPEGFSERAYFLIDESGTIRWKHVMPQPGLRLENSDILEATRAV